MTVTITGDRSGDTSSIGDTGSVSWKTSVSMYMLYIIVG